MSKSPKKGPGRPRSVDPQAIVQSATEVYRVEGVDALSLNEVVRRVGVSKPVIYREFGGEDGLMDACLSHYWDNAFLPLLGMLDEDIPVGDALNNMLNALAAPRDAPPGCLFTHMRISEAQLGAASTARVADFRHKARAKFEDWFRRGLQRGEVDATLTPAFAGVYFDTQLMTLLAQVGLGEDPETARALAAFALGRLLA